MKAKRDFPSKNDEHEAGGCRKVDMMVNSSDLGLFVSVLYPQNFNAYQCRGKCDLKQRHKFINHSLVKAFLLKDVNFYYEVIIDEHGVVVMLSRG